MHSRVALESVAAVHVGAARRRAVEPDAAGAALAVVDVAPPAVVVALARLARVGQRALAPRAASAGRANAKKGGIIGFGFGFVTGPRTFKSTMHCTSNFLHG